MSYSTLLPKKFIMGPSRLFDDPNATKGIMNTLKAMFLAVPVVAGGVLTR